MSETEPVAHIGEQMPRVGSVSHHGAYEIVVSWVSGPRETNADIVDLAPVILTHKFYRPLRDNPEMLKTVHIIADGAAIAWGDDDAIDMAATTIERLAEETMDSADFRVWLERHKFTYDAASAQLGISRRLVAYYASRRRVPRYIALACRYLDSELLPKSALPPALSSGLIGPLSTGLLEKGAGLLGKGAGLLGKGAFEELEEVLHKLTDEEIEAWLRLSQALQTPPGAPHETIPKPRRT